MGTVNGPISSSTPGTEGVPKSEDRRGPKFQGDRVRYIQKTILTRTAGLSGWVGKGLRTVSGKIPKIQAGRGDLAHDCNSGLICNKSRQMAKARKKMRFYSKTSKKSKGGFRSLTTNHNNREQPRAGDGNDAFFQSREKITVSKS